MKIHTKIVIDLASGEVIKDEFYDYDGPVALAGGGSPPAQPSTTTQIQEPWEQQKPFLETGFQRAETDVLERPLEFFPGSTVVPYSQETETALGAQTNRALAGSPLLGAAQGEVGSNLAGDYISGGNPYFAGMAERAIRPMRREFTETVLPGIASGYAQGGRLPGAPTGIGGGAFETSQNRAADTYLRNVGDVGSNLAFNTYNTERQNMMNAAGMAAPLAREDYADIGRLRDVGQAREELTNAQLGEEMSRFAFGQAEPGQRIEDYMRLVTGNFGGTSSITSPGGAGSNSLLQLAGGAALGTGMANK